MEAKKFIQYLKDTNVGLGITVYKLLTTDNIDRTVYLDYYIDCKERERDAETVLTNLDFQKSSFVLTSFSQIADRLQRDV